MGAAYLRGMADRIDNQRPVAAPQQPNRVDAFRNMFAILHNLDLRDMAGIDSDANPWRLDRLSSFVLKLDDARLDALYALVQSKQPAKYREVA